MKDCIVEILDVLIGDWFGDCVIGERGWGLGFGEELFEGGDEWGLGSGEVEMGGGGKGGVAERRERREEDEERETEYGECYEDDSVLGSWDLLACHFFWSVGVCRCVHVSGTVNERRCILSQIQF